MNYIESNNRTAGTIPVWNSQANKAQQKNADGFGFGDLLDIINPLQHIPLVNMAYQGMTGDEIKPVSQVVGGAVFGGVIGAGSAIANVAIEAETGKNIGEHAIAMVETESISTPTTYATGSYTDHPEDNLNNALAELERMDALSAIAFTDLGYAHAAHQPHREAITTQRLSAMPAPLEF